MPGNVGLGTGDQKNPPGATMMGITVVEDVVEEPLDDTSVHAVVIVVVPVKSLRAVIWSSEKACVVPSEVYTVVGSVYTSVNEVVAPEGAEVGGKVIVVITPPIVTTTFGGWMLDVKVKVSVVSLEFIGIFQNKISLVVTRH